jgi:hypothetical protein
MIERMRFLASWAWAFLRPLIRELLSDRGRLLADVARQVVGDLEDSELSGPERRAVATERIRDHIREVWADVPSVLLHAVIEAAIVHLRNRDS